MKSEPSISRSSWIATRDPKALLSGLFFIAFGALFFWIGSDYDFGTGRRMGPGFFPQALAIVLGVIGLITILTSKENAGAKSDPINLKGLILVPASAVLFAVAIRELGLALVVVLMVVVGALASRYFRPLHAVAVGVLLSIFCVAVFVYGLGLPMPVLGSWFGL
jgi:hypothetical protein